MKQRAAEQQKTAPDLADVKYGPGERQVLDVWLAEADEPTPVLIFFHGGGWRGGNKALTVQQQTCLPKGITAVSATYRITTEPGITLLDCEHDGARVVQFVRSKAAEWNIDPNRVAVSGSSAGGVMSLWLAFHDDLADPGNADPLARVSTRVSCAVVSGTPTNLDPGFVREHVGGQREHHPAVLAALGVNTTEELQRPDKRRLTEECSPMAHASEDDPPVYLIYGNAPPDGLLPDDAEHGVTIHSARFGIPLKEKLDKLGVPCSLEWPGRTPPERWDVFLEKHLQVNQAGGKV